MSELTTNTATDSEWVAPGAAPDSAPPTPPPASPSPAPALSSNHPEPSPRNLGGAPKSNQSAVKSGLRRSAGSKLPKGCSRVGTHVRTLVARTEAAWRAKHGLSDSDPLPLAADRLVHQIRRAEERDRLAAKQLADGTDLKGNPLSFDQQERLQEAQEAAGKLIESCLRKLGLDLDQNSATADPWAVVDRQSTAGRFSPAQASPQAALDDSEHAPAARVPPNASEKLATQIGGGQ